ncbi:MAG: hypothetical protein ACFFKA_12435 [Candidatus Thorarchaeota archaeon]
MDTEYDFLRPEFLDIIFFQQKNLVIFPYVDVKHLKALEIFAEGYAVIDIDTTALHNVSDILAHEVQQSYSHKPTLHFILNANLSIIKDLMELPEIHCIINTSENPEPLIKDNEFIFYNKKSKQFLNYDINQENLVFEIDLLQSSQDEHILAQKLRDLHSIAAQIHIKINEQFSSKGIYPFLEPFDPLFWPKLLRLTSRYYDIKLPKITIPQQVTSRPKRNELVKDVSREYKQILKSNCKIGQEFIQALHEYRMKKVNPAHLELEQLFYPEQLYSYLRNHHWEKGISQEFIDEWVLMKNTGHILDANDLMDFQILFQELNIPFQNIPKQGSHLPEGHKSLEANQLESTPYIKGIPCTEVKGIPVVYDFSNFKQWILDKVARLEQIMELRNLKS